MKRNYPEFRYPKAEGNLVSRISFNYKVLHFDFGFFVNNGREIPFLWDGFDV